RGVCVVRGGGRIGMIVPMPLLGDEQAVGVRKMLLTSTSFAAVEAFPQKDDSKNRVFEDAKLSTCIFVTCKKRRMNHSAPGSIQVKTSSPVHHPFSSGQVRSNYTILKISRSLPAARKIGTWLSKS